MPASEDTWAAGMREALAIFEATFADPDWDGQCSLGFAATVDQMITERVIAAEQPRPPSSSVRGPHHDFVIVDELPGMWEAADLSGGEADSANDAQMQDPPDSSWATTAPIGDKASWELPTTDLASVELFHGAPSRFGPGKVHLAHHDGNRWTARCRADYPGYLMELGVTDQVTCKSCRSRFL